MPKLPYGDLKYYYQIHVKKQEAKWLTPVSYENFTRRFKKMSLHDAIYKPRYEHKVRYNMKPKKTLLQKFISFLERLWLKKES